MEVRQGRAQGRADLPLSPSACLARPIFLIPPTGDLAWTAALLLAGLAASGLPLCRWPRADAAAGSGPGNPVQFRPADRARRARAPPGPMRRPPAPRRMCWKRSTTTPTASCVQDRLCPVGQAGRPASLSRHLLPPRPLFPEAGAHACAGGRQGARNHLSRGLFRHAGRFPRQGPAGGAGFAGFRFQEPVDGRSTGRRTTGSPFSARPISAPSANSTNTACPPAA
jgi:hypothetical protein